MKFTVIHSVTCEHCDADLTQPKSIEVDLSDGERVYAEILTCVDDMGELVDPDERISIGHHAGSRCVKCQKMLAQA